MLKPVLDKCATWFRAAKALRPPPDEPFSAWIERTVQLPQGLAAEPGPVKLYPYQRAIADAVGDPNIARVTWQKSVRAGFTFLLCSAIGRHVLDDPAPIILLMPTQDDARSIIVDDVRRLARHFNPHAEVAEGGSCTWP